MKRTRLFIGVAFVISAILVTYALSSAQALVGPITFPLEQENGSGQSGSVTLTDLGGGRTLVEVTASGVPAGVSQPMQVHEGQCGPTLARLVYPLNNLENGKSTTTISASLSTLTSNNLSFAINSHKSEQDYRLYVLCGNIPSLAQMTAQATATQQALEALQTRPPGGISPVTFSLVPESDSGQSGTVTLTDLGGGTTMVQVNVTGEPVGASQPLHIHEGQCGPSLARLAFQLQDLVDGKSETTIDASLNSLTTEGFAFAINSHKSQKEYTIYVLCGNIPSVAQMTTTVAAPTSGIAAATLTVPGAAVATTIAPTAAAVAPTAAVVIPTATTAAPTATTVPPTATTAAPAATTVPPTATTAAPAATAVPPTATMAAPAATAVPPTATMAAPAATAVPPTATTAAPTAAVAAATATVVPPTATLVAPTSMAAEPTSASGAATAEATTSASGAATAVAPTTTSVAPTTAAAPTATPGARMPESGGNPYSSSFLGLVMLGILVLAAGLSVLQFSERGSKGM